MNIYLVKSIENVDWDDYAGFVVVATDEKGARVLCSEEDPDGIWEDPRLSSCDLLGTAIKNTAKILMEDYKSG